MDADTADSITQPIPAPSPPGSVVADAGFTHFFGCQCNTGDGRELRVVAGVAECMGKDQDNMHRRLIIAIVLVAVLPQLAIGLGILIFVK